MPDTTEYLSTKDAARFLKFSHRPLEGMRYRGLGPKYIRLNNSRIRYRKQDLIRWIEQGAEPQVA